MKQSKNLTTGLSSGTVKAALRTDYDMLAKPRLIVDWNWNRYTNPTVTNKPSEDDEGFDVEAFPIESIVEPLRPSKGIAKARLDQATVSRGYVGAKQPRFYVGSTDDVYKYWTSPYTTDGAGNFPQQSGATTARPRVDYDRIVQANKIVIKVENTWASPKTYRVKIANTVNGTLGNTPLGGNNPAMDSANGVLTLYYNGAGWVTTRPANLVKTNVAAIEFSVDAMGPGIKRDGTIMQYRQRAHGSQMFNTDGSNSSLNVIAIEAHLEVDMTDRLISVDDNFDMSDYSQLYPIGTITTNQASVTLSNEDGVFNVENPTSPYKDLIEQNAEFNLEYIFELNGVRHSVQQFKMYVNGPWSSSDDGTVTVELDDYSKYLKELKPNAWMVEDKTSTEIIWRVLDSVGFNNYEIQLDDRLNEHIIPVFWTDGEQTAWEILDEVAKATQTAIYFDSNGNLQVRTRSAAFRDTAAVDWNLLGETSGSNLADIISWSANAEHEANKIDVVYRSTKWKVNSLGKPAMSSVWTPDNDTLSLRSSPLTTSMGTDDDTLFIGQSEIVLWPYTGKLQVDGEIMTYKGKRFIYWTGTNGMTKNVVTVTSEDQKRKFNRLSDKEHQSKNGFTGALVISERGTWNSDVRAHTIDLSGWTTKSEIKGTGTALQQYNARGFSQNRTESTATINSPPELKSGDDTFWAIRGQSGATGYKVYGTRIRFNNDSAASHQIAGFALQLSGARENGYYINIRLSKNMTASYRAVANEVSINSRTASGEVILAKGVPTAIGVGIWYDLDVYKTGTGNTQTLSVWINGQKVAEGTTNAANNNPDGGRFGFFTRGQTNVSFEYAYAIARTVNEPSDDYGFFDLKYGGIRGGQWEREYVWKTRTRWKKIKKKKWKKETYKHNEYIFDEFGPYVHEVREFDVKFDPFPVRYSYLFSTNEWYAANVEYTSNPFGAKFILANTGRHHAILHGEDNLMYAGASAGVNQVCVVLGQNLDIGDDETVTRKNAAAIRARGEIPVELSSDWIQSKSMAEDLAVWMGTHWSKGVDEVEVEIFGNPLIELGDIVDVNYPLENATPATHRYFVVGTRNEFDSGLSTTLTLRRQRTTLADELT